MLPHPQLQENDPLLQGLFDSGDHPQRLVTALQMLGFVLVVDGCARNCKHCPAHGYPSRPRIMPWDLTCRTLAMLREKYAALQLVPPARAMHCWRISDPLDYRDDVGDGIVDCVDLASIWQDTFAQGLYLVTNGSDGKAELRQTLRRIAQSPSLFSQVKLTITPFDVDWGKPSYYANISQDFQILAPLWDLPSTRVEDAEARRFRINVKVSPSSLSEAERLVTRLLQERGHSARGASRILADRRYVSIKPVYDLRISPLVEPIPDAITIQDASGQRFKPSGDQRSRYQFGLRPDLTWFLVDMYRFFEWDIAPGVIPSVADPLLGTRHD